MNKIKKIWQRCKSWTSRTWQRTLPNPRVRKGASIAIVVMVILVAASFGLLLTPGFPVPKILDSLAGFVGVSLGAALLGVLAFLIIKFITILPKFVNWLGLIALLVFVFVFLLFQFPFPIALLLGLGLGLLQAFLGGGIAALSDREFKFCPWPKKAFVFVIILVPLAINILLLSWLFNRGRDDHLVPFEEKPPIVESLRAANPGLPGMFKVQTLTYGSGADKHRPEFGSKAAIKTDPVDATPFVKGNSGLGIKLRNWYWGFDFKEFPVNGRVWYPEGDGPYPLVLIVHGNHKMQHFSDPGYAYLGELLASRGFILVSVDENFFNGSAFGGLRKENDGRGWMLLQHLKVWRNWNEDESNPFFGKVDMANIGLIGHSRGGEAAAIAGAFNRLSYYPDDATVKFDFGFDIKAVISIAPSDQQYKPAGKPTPLENVNYFVFQGGHDMDVSFFMGLRQYNRVRFTDGHYWIKASLLSYRSNHGQFNTVWGDSDQPRPLNLLLNRKALLDGEEQRKISKVMISAFLEYSLKGKTAYLSLFRDHRLARDWLPDDYFINRFEDSTFRLICGFEEDVDVLTASVEGGRIRSENLTVWREADLHFRTEWGTKENNVVFLGWGIPGQEELSEEIASYTIQIPGDLSSEAGIGRDSLLVFHLAEADEEPPEPEDEEDEIADDGDKKERAKKDEKAEEGEEEHKPVELSLELVTADGVAAKLPLERFRPAPPMLRSRFSKLKNEISLFGKDYEPTLQVFELPLDVFAAEFPGFDPSRLREIRFVFDRTPEGVILLDNIGFAQLRFE
jgi:hypothetical protein